MLQTLKTQLPPSLVSPEYASFAAQTTTTNVLVDEKEACLMPNSGPMSKTYRLPPRRQPRAYKASQQHASSPMSSPAYKKQSASEILDAVGAGSMDKISIPRLRKQNNEQEEQQSAPSTPTVKASSRQTSLSGTIAVDSDTSADKGVEMQMEAETKIGMETASPTLLQQRRDHWNGLHLGRDPYGLASKPYLDAGQPPPWPRCDVCEEEMPWLQRNKRLEVEQHLEMFLEVTGEQFEGS